MLSAEVQMLVSCIFCGRTPLYKVLFVLAGGREGLIDTCWLFKSNHVTYQVTELPSHSQIIMHVSNVNTCMHDCLAPSQHHAFVI